MHSRWKYIREEEKKEMHTVNVILHETLEIYLTPKHSLCACKLSPYSCRLGAHGLCGELGVWLHTTGLHGTFCSLCVIHCYIYGKLKRSRIPLAQKYCIFWFNLCFNPHNASLVRLYGCNPEPIDLSGKLPTSSTRLLITACTCDANFTPKSCANQVCHQPNFSRLYITKS